MTAVLLGGRRKGKVASPFVWGTVQSVTVDFSACQVLVDGSTTTLTAYLPVHLKGTVTGDRVNCYVQGQKFYVNANFTEPQWISATLTSPWANYNAVHSTALYENAGFLKEKDNEVRLRGLVAGGANGSGIFILPVGYRPMRGVQGGPIYSIVDGTNTGHRVDVLMDGTVSAQSISNNAFVSLSGITFRAG